MHEFRDRTRTQPILARAWARDAQGLLQEFRRSHRRLSPKCPSASFRHILFDTVGVWEQILNQLIDSAERSFGTQWWKVASSPYRRPIVPIPPPSEAASEMNGGGVTARTKLKIATFGWFELREPTRADMEHIMNELRRLHVHVCVVTSLPSAVVKCQLEGQLGYHWMGEWHTDNSSVGILVATMLQGMHPGIVRDLPHQSGISPWKSVI